MDSDSSSTPKPPAKKRPLANDFLGKRDHSTGGMVYSTEKKSSMVLVSRLLAFMTRKSPLLQDGEEHAAEPQG